MHKQTCKRAFYNQKPNSKNHKLQQATKKGRSKNNSKNQKWGSWIFSFGLKINHFMGCGSSLAGCIQSQGVRVPNSNVNVCQKTKISD